MRRVLFVDDEPHVLESLRDALRPWRRELDMSFAQDGPSALAQLERVPFDAVVSDMRMPGMDGATLLGNVQQLRPATVRIVLSGYAEIEPVARAATVAHRFLAKPCDVEALVRVIQSSCDVNALIEQDDLLGSVTGAGRLPTAPRLYSKLVALMSDPDATVADAAGLVEQDVAVTAKILQLANSAFFGRPRPVTDIAGAITYLGMNTLKSLALSADCIEAFQPARTIDGFSIDHLQSHAAHVARITRRLISAGGEADGAVAAALVHDVGILVLAARAPDGLESVLARAADEGRPLFEVEQEERGFTHADVGAHLLSLWGLPEVIVEAVAQHHRPAANHEPGMNAVTAVHVACALAHGDAEHLDDEHVVRAGVLDRLPQWYEIAAEEAQR